jgi:ADP-ribose pyrophosphatase
MPKSSTPTKRPAKTAKARLVSSRVVYRGPVFWVSTDHVVEPGSVKVRRDLIHHSGSIVVLAVDDSGPTPLVLLERQYRHAAKDFLWELPAAPH